MAGLLEMFDPARHKPKDIGLGGPSTEYLVTGQDDAGRWFNYPTIQWRGDEPVKMNDEAARALALHQEKTQGGLLPRYETMEEAVAAARQRSAGGGGLMGVLMQGLGP